MKVDGFQGKPILMLCNKADVDEARDEVHIVNTLQVERLVNEARSKTITRVPFDILNLRIEKIHWGLGIRIVWIPRLRTPIGDSLSKHFFKFYPNSLDTKSPTSIQILRYLGI